MIPLDKIPFGMEIIWLFEDNNFVTKIWISNTVPDTFWASMASPTLNGLNKIINIPPAKFDSEPCNDKPIAKPAAPKIATNDEVSIPSFEMNETSNKTFKTQFKISSKNFDNVASISRATIIFREKFLMIFITYKPINNNKKAPTSFGQKSKIIFQICDE